MADAMRTLFEYKRATADRNWRWAVSEIAEAQEYTNRPPGRGEALRLISQMETVIRHLHAYQIALAQEEALKEAQAAQEATMTP